MPARSRAITAISADIHAGQRKASMIGVGAAAANAGPPRRRPPQANAERLVALVVLPFTTRAAVGNLGASPTPSRARATMNCA